MKRIGIFGGTFNPPHLGHIQVARQALTALNLQKVLLIPNYIAPHKPMDPLTPPPEDLSPTLIMGYARLEAEDIRQAFRRLKTAWGSR